MIDVRAGEQKIKNIKGNRINGGGRVSSVRHFPLDKRGRVRRTCTLIVTRRCNLNCTYCYEDYKCMDETFDMSFTTAKSILVKEFDSVANFESGDCEIEIDFMGGEPLMNFSLIRQVVEWLEKEPPPVPYICFATTNGTLAAQHKDWLIRHRERFILGLSFDGTDEMQMSNRGTKAGCSVSIDLFRSLYPSQGFHMTVSRKSLRKLAEGVLFLQRRGCTVEVALAQGEEWEDVDAEEYKHQLEILALAYLSDKLLNPINLFCRFLGGIDGKPESVSQQKYCGTGTNMVAYDYNGKKYGCHLFTPLVLGANARTCDEIKFPRAVEDEFCRFCVLKSVCPTCAGFNYRDRGDIRLRDHRWCNLVLQQFKVTSVFQMKYIVSLISPTSEDVRYLRAARKAKDVIDMVTARHAPFCLSEGE